MQDIFIKNALIIDGSGRPAFLGGVCIDKGFISGLAPHLGNIAAKRVIDAQGMVLAPGFIDVHSHDDLVFFESPYNKAKLLQGVTSVITGNCGFGPCPCSAQNRQLLSSYASPVLGDGIAKHSFRSFKEYCAALSAMPKAMNIGALLAHGSMYVNEKGFSDSPISPKEAQTMADELKESLAAGALGLSLGLMYAPGAYCSTDDFLPLSKILADHAGLLCVHLRSESERLEQAIEDIIKLNQLCGVSIHLSHLKKVGYTFQGQIGPIIKNLEKQIKQGLDLTFDIYPYSIGSTTMSILMPPHMLNTGIEGCLELLRHEATRQKLKDYLRRPWADADNLALFCGWDNIIIISPEILPGLGHAGRSIEQIARDNNLEADETCIRIFEAAQGQATVLLRNMDDNDLESILTAQHCFIATDGLPAGKTPHPRLYGTYPKFIEFVLKEKSMTLEQAVSKITSQPAKRFKLGKRGKIKTGYYADLVIFEPSEFKDHSSFENPRQHPQGLHHVFVAGQPVVENTEISGLTSGHFLSRQQL